MTTTKHDAPQNKATREHAAMEQLQGKREEAVNTRAAWRPLLRPGGRILIAAQLALVLQPLSVLAQDKGQLFLNPQTPIHAQAQLQKLGIVQQNGERAKAAAQVIEGKPEANNRQLARAQELVRDLKADTGAARMRAPSKTLAKKQEQQQQLQSSLDAIEADSASVLAEFVASRAQLQAKGLPLEILSRHDQAVQTMRERAQQLSQLTAAWKQNPGDFQLGNLAQFFEQFPAIKRHNPINPDNLPWSAPKGTPRMPAETKTAWYQQLNGDQKIQLAQAGVLTTIGGVQFTHPPEPTQAPQDADLAETVDIQLTPAIHAKAQELNNNPVAISNWVRSTVQYVPTWGSMQGAAGTLLTLKGNAFDIASLTIALLRASGVPARYQFGTVDIPATQVTNWVGGLSRPETALDLLYQGGVAARGINSGGQFATIRMEHVWVNAYVNWSPSRGARDGGWNLTPRQHLNPNAALNRWVPLDTSFKQYAYNSGMDLEGAVSVDAPALMTAVQQGATVTPDYVQNLNQANLQAQLASFQNRVRAYINGTPTGPNSTVDDVLGRRSIVAQTFTLLPGTLPYSVVVSSNERAEVPDALRWKISFQGYELDGAGGQGNALIAHTFSLSELLHKRVGITYEGATESDRVAIANYRSSGATSFPAYALQVRPLFQLDGNTVLTGQGLGMGKETEWQVRIVPAGQTAASGNQQAYLAAAGDETVWAVIADSVSASELQSTVFPDTSAGQLHAVGMSYWHQVDSYARLIARREDAIAQRMPSLGAISSGLRVQFNWGIARNAHYLSRTMDIGHSTIGVQGMNSAAFQRELGMRTSYLEGNIFDQVFERETGSGISAARLIQTAIESGQRIFTLTNGNADQFLGQIQMSAAVREDIINGLLMGLEITIPESTQNVNGWEGTAYIMIRPETGAGSYIISGSLRGGDEGADCQLQPSTSPSKATNFSPAVLFAAAIIAMYLIASLGPIVVPLLVLSAVAQSAVAAPAPQLSPSSTGAWNRLSGGRPWPTQLNWPPAGSPNASPPGMCTPQQHAALEAAKAEACGRPSSCKGTDNCAQLEIKIQNKIDCVAARLAVMDTCFQGGDQEHWTHLQQLINGMNTCQTCKSRLIASQQCTGGN